MKQIEEFNIYKVAFITFFHNSKYKIKRREEMQVGSRSIQVVLRGSNECFSWFDLHYRNIKLCCIRIHGETSYSK